MAYNFFQTGYQPYQMNNQGMQWVQGESAAKSYPVAPNTTVALWDSEENVVYIKSADMSGMPSIKILDYVVRSDAPKQAEIGVSEAFATKEDILHLQEEIDAVKANMGEVKEKKNGK